MTVTSPAGAVLAEPAWRGRRLAHERRVGGWLRGVTPTHEGQHDWWAVCKRHEADNQGPNR